MSASTPEILARATLIIAAALVLALIWLLFDVILIVVGAILVAVLLRLVAEPLVRYIKLPESAALLLAAVIVVGILSGTLYLFGSHLEAEFQDVLQRLDTAQRSITKTLQGSPLGKVLLSHMGGTNLSITDVLTRIFTISASFVEAVIIAFIAGIYLAVHPTLYRTGLIKLFPARWRASGGETVDDVGNALRLWMLGQFVQMLLIGLLSAVAAWLIGLPSPLALGLIAGLLEIIPYLGPVLAAIPALLVAATQNVHAIVWTALAYTIIHQIEGNLISPMISRHVVFIPPAVILLGLVTTNFVFGTVALVFAAPMTVIASVIIQKLYVRDTLGEVTEIPGEPKG